MSPRLLVSWICMRTCCISGWPMSGGGWPRPAGVAGRILVSRFRAMSARSWCGCGRSQARPVPSSTGVRSMITVTNPPSLWRVCDQRCSSTPMTRTQSSREVSADTIIWVASIAMVLTVRESQSEVQDAEGGHGECEYVRLSAPRASGRHLAMAVLIHAFTAASYQSVISGLTGAAWLGPARVAMTARP